MPASSIAASHRSRRGLGTLVVWCARSIIPAASRKLSREVVVGITFRVTIDAGRLWMAAIADASDGSATRASLRLDNGVPLVSSVTTIRRLSWEPAARVWGTPNGNRSRTPAPSSCPTRCSEFCRSAAGAVSGEEIEMTRSSDVRHVTRSKSVVDESR